MFQQYVLEAINPSQHNLDGLVDLLIQHLISRKMLTRKFIQRFQRADRQVRHILHQVFMHNHPFSHFPYEYTLSQCTRKASKNCSSLKYYFGYRSRFPFKVKNKLAETKSARFRHDHSGRTNNFLLQSTARTRYFGY